MSEFNLADIATLAQLDLSAAETERLTADLDAILGYVQRLSQVDTTGVEPLAHPILSQAPLRPDQARTWFSQSEAIANAPASREGMFEVPKIVDRG